MLAALGYGALAAAALLVAGAFQWLARRKARVRPAARPADCAGPAAVVLPISGRYDEARQFRVWDAVLAQDYAAPAEFLFVVESRADPACAHLRAYARARGYGDPAEPQPLRGRPGHCFRLVVAGVSHHNAQKVHSMLEGVAQAAGRPAYLAFLDDDIEPHPLTLRNLVGPLREGAGLATGYSVEVPAAPALTSYMVMAYRAFNLLGFAREAVGYCWGGCFAVAARDFEASGIRAVYLDGGYSDDMTIGNLFKAAGRRIRAREQNMFLNTLAPPGFARYYNYVLRQYFVLTTYYGPRDRAVNAVALAQLAAAGLAVQAIAVAIAADLAASALGRRWRRLALGLALVLGCAYLIGTSVNGAVGGLERLARRMAGSRAPARRLSWPLAAAAVALHFALAPAMVAHALFVREVRWGPARYRVRGGRVARVDRGAPGAPSKRASLARYFARRAPGYDLKQVQ